tara:strand:+ start:1509 stop:1751 length:243 start_codon:yes stop_codon:yes gene_type:complete
MKKKNIVRSMFKNKKKKIRQNTVIKLSTYFTGMDELNTVARTQKKEVSNHVPIYVYFERIPLFLQHFRSQPARIVDHLAV